MHCGASGISRVIFRRGGAGRTPSWHFRPPRAGRSRGSGRLRPPGAWRIGRTTCPTSATPTRRPWQSAGNSATKKAWRRVPTTSPSRYGLVPSKARSRELFLSSREMFERLDNRLGVADTLWALAMIEALEGDPSTARRQAEESVRLHRELGDAFGLVDALQEQGRAALELGELDVARSELCRDAGWARVDRLSNRSGNRPRRPRGSRAESRASGEGAAPRRGRRGAQRGRRRASYHPNSRTPIPVAPPRPHCPRRA